jgi:hypothetical protein
MGLRSRKPRDPAQGNHLPDVGQETDPKDDALPDLEHKVHLGLGIVLILIVMSVYAGYLYTLHENQLWFTNIKVSILYNKE